MSSEELSAVPIHVLEKRLKKSEKHIEKLEAQPDPGQGLAPAAAEEARAQHVDQLKAANRAYLDLHQAWERATDPQRLANRGVWEQARSAVFRRARAETMSEEDKEFHRGQIAAREAQEHERKSKRELAQAKEARRAGPPDPRAASVTAAVLADADFLFDGLKRRLREVEEPTQYGGVRTSMSSEPVFEPEDIAVAFTVLHLLHERGSIVIEQWGSGGQWPEGSDLPPTQRLASRLAHLAANGLFTISADESDPSRRRIGYGPQVRHVAARWGIKLPEPEEGKEKPAATA